VVFTSAEGYESDDIMRVTVGVVAAPEREVFTEVVSYSVSG
jgi:hypothetical protein